MSCDMLLCILRGRVNSSHVALLLAPGEVSCEGAELRSFRGSWSKLRSMLSEPDASRSGKSGVVSSSTRRYLKLEIGSVHLCEGHERAGECSDERKGDYARL